MVKNTKRPRGRPRTFDENEAIRMATKVFWRKGFDGATIDDLVEGMGVRRPSLYAIFGDKSALFMRCLKAYRDNLGKLAGGVLFGPADVREAIRSLLRFSVETATDRWLTARLSFGLRRTACGRRKRPTVPCYGLRGNHGSNSYAPQARSRGEGTARLISRAKNVLGCYGHVPWPCVRARIGVPRQQLLEDADRAAELLLHV